MIRFGFNVEGKHLLAAVLLFVGLRYFGVV
jgi:hypothetical protein